MQVEYVMVYGAKDDIIVRTTGGTEYVAGCSVNHWSIEADTEERRNRMYSTLLAAAIAGQSIRIWYDSTGCGPFQYHVGNVLRVEM